MIIYKYLVLNQNAVRNSIRFAPNIEGNMCFFYSNVYHEFKVNKYFPNITETFGVLAQFCDISIIVTNYWILEIKKSCIILNSIQRLIRKIELDSLGRSNINV